MLQLLACSLHSLIRCSKKVTSAPAFTGSVSFLQQTCLLSVEDEGRLPFCHSCSVPPVLLTTARHCSLQENSTFDLSTDATEDPEGLLWGGYAHHGVLFHSCWLQMAGQGAGCISVECSAFVIRPYKPLILLWVLGLILQTEAREVHLCFLSKCWNRVSYYALH